MGDFNFDPPSTPKLIYNNTLDTSTIQNVLLISSSVYESQLFYDSANSNTFPIIYSPNSDNNEFILLLRNKFQNGIQRISFAFHDPLNNIKTFLDNKPFFYDNDLIENQTTFSQNFTFLTHLITEFKVVNCDFLACNTLQYSNWTTYFHLLNKLTNVICGASNDNTGNILYGANWIMENTNENVRDIYFTNSINNYASSLTLITFILNSVVYTPIDSSTVSVYEYLQSSPLNWNLVIPSTVIYGGNNYNVTSIGDNAFSNCTTLISIIIPNSVTSIGAGAFYRCSSLPSITIPNSVTTIGGWAFTWCTSLTSATIGSSVTSIGNSAFQNCTLLTSVQIDNQAAITYLGTNIFNIHSVIPTNKTVLFYNTAHYYFLTDPIGRNIANYFSSDPSNFTNSSISYSSYSSPACFNEDTKILSLNKDGEEEYIPIQNLRKGDLVKSYLHGYRKIDLIGKDKMFNDPSKFTRCMYLFEKTDHNDLIEDLIVTGGHSILVDQLTDQEQLNQSTVWDIQYKIDDKVLLLAGFSSLFKPITTQKIFTWYHFTLECEDDDQRFGVFANGVLVEIPSKNQFKDFNIQEI